MAELYSIRINATGRYVKYCDEHWYETVGTPLSVFTKQQAQDVAKQMRSHYVYDVTISNGTESFTVGLKDGFAKKPEKKAKKSFKFSLKLK